MENLFRFVVGEGKLMKIVNDSNIHSLLVICKGL